MQVQVMKNKKVKVKDNGVIDLFPDDYVGMCGEVVKSTSNEYLVDFGNQEWCFIPKDCCQTIKLSKKDIKKIIDENEN